MSKFTPQGRGMSTKGTTPRQPDDPMPHSIDAEMSVLGSILIDPEAVGVAANIIAADDFYRDAHHPIYEAALDLYEAKKPRDLVSLCDELERRGKLEEVGGSSYVSSLANYVLTSAQEVVEHHCRIVLEHAIRRKDLYTAARLMRGEIDGQEAARLMAENHARRDATCARGFTLKDLMGEQLAPLRWIVPDWLPEGLAILAAKQKIGKSWLALQLAIALASGGVFLGQRLDAAEALYLALEDGKRRLQSRASKLLGRDPVPEGLHLETQWPRLDAGGLARLDRWLTNHPAVRLVIIDVFQKVRPPKSKNGDAYAEDYVAMGGLKALADAHHVALLVIHHTRKAAAEDVFDEITGSTGVAAACDVVMVLQRTRGEKEAKLHITGREIANESAYALRFDGLTCAWQLLGDAREYEMSQQRRAIVEAIREAGTELGPKEVAEALGQTDPNRRSTIKNLMQAMAKDGQLYANGGKYNVPHSLHSLHSPRSLHSPHSPDAEDDGERTMRTMEVFKPVVLHSLAPPQDQNGSAHVRTTRTMKTMQFDGDAAKREQVIVQLAHEMQGEDPTLSDAEALALARQDVENEGKM